MLEVDAVASRMSRADIVHRAVDVVRRGVGGSASDDRAVVGPETRCKGICRGATDPLRA
jgi:hypothetical protein